MVASPRERRVLVLLGAHGPSAVVRGLAYRDKLNRPPYRARFEKLYWTAFSEFRERVAAATARHPLLPPAIVRPLGGALVVLKWLAGARLVPALGSYDAIWLIKYFSPAFVRALRSLTRAKILYDLDDAMWLPEFLGAQRFEELIGLVDAVSCDNAYLLERVRATNPRAFVLRGPAHSSPGARRRAKRPDEPVLIGWVGSPSTRHYLEIVKEPLQRLAAALPGRARLRVVGSGDYPWRWPEIPGLDIETVAQYDQAEMLRQLGELDVGLFPLHDDENSLGRGVLKATIYMGAGIPAVCSAVGELPSFLRQGETGFACASADDWTATLTTLVSDGALRQHVGAAGRALVEREFSLDHCFAVLEREFLDRL
jgi:glycosyltransferase involved in cell wall biosynthesis